MKIQELKQKTKKELEKFLVENQTKLQQLRFELITGKVKNIKEIREIKKNIAKTKTLLNEKIWQKNN